MSQALEIYQNHQFHKTWQSFKDEFNKGYIPEQINDPVRLENYDIINKKIEFIDNWLSLVDPELGMTNTHLTTANNFINTAKSHIINEQGYASRNDTRNAISNLNNCIFKVSECVDTIIKLPIAIPKVTSNSITRMLNSYRDTIQQALTEINLEKTKNDAVGIKNYKQELINNNDSISKTIEKEFKEIKNKYNEINEFYNETLVNGKNSISTKQEIINGKESIFKEIEQIKNRIDNFNVQLDELNKFYENIFGSSDKQTIGLKQELESRIKQLDEMEQKHNQKYQAMFNEIESLLEGATNVGLAKAFNDEKEKYPKIINAWNAAFYLSIIFLLYWGRKIYIEYQHSFNEPISFLNMLGSFLPTSIITISLIWLAVYASKRHSENRRLEQEYAHKKAMALSYSSYKKQIEELGTDEKEKLLSQLMSTTIETIAYNPSPTLDKKHGDGTVLNEIPNTLKEILEIIKTFKK
ncbi:MAG: hypothetical protein J6M43_06550 [Neisseriaceae bacterium]|nr:hypothetical protein [Neisseriaceae bacterium]